MGIARRPRFSSPSVWPRASVNASSRRRQPCADARRFAAGTVPGSALACRRPRSAGPSGGRPARPCLAATSSATGSRRAGATTRRIRCSRRTPAGAGSAPDPPRPDGRVAVDLLPRRRGRDGGRPRRPAEHRARGPAVWRRARPQLRPVGHAGAPPLFDLRDFDETLPGPFEWDVKRWLASLVVLARDNGLPRGEAPPGGRRGARGYRAGCPLRRGRRAGDLVRPVDVADLLELLRARGPRPARAQLNKQARKRTTPGRVEKLTEIVDGRLRILQEPPFRVLRRPAPSGHVARGRRRLRPLAAVGPGATSRPFRLRGRRRARSSASAASGCRCTSCSSRDAAVDDPLFLQIKQAGPSVYERPPSGRAPAATHGQRVDPRQAPVADGHRHLRRVDVGRRLRSSTSASSAT